MTQPVRSEHCSRHSHTYLASEACPRCEVERLQAEALQSQVEALRAYNQRLLDGRSA